jgi:hypothetical protein
VAKGVGVDLERVEAESILKRGEGNWGRSVSGRGNSREYGNISGGDKDEEEE